MMKDINHIIKLIKKINHLNFNLKKIKENE